MLMKKLTFGLFSIAVCFSCISFSFAETADIDAEYTEINTETDIETENTQRLNLSFTPYELSSSSIIEYNLYKFREKDDLLDYISNPYISDLSKSLNKESLYSYALSYYGSADYNVTASPVEKYSAGITTFSIKSMNIFSVNDYDTAINNSIYSFILSSVLGFATKDLISLNIWSGTDNYGVAGFQATFRPFKNLHAAYSYLTDQKYNKSIIKLNYGYKKYSNLAFKTMNTFSEHYTNTTFGIEWQFYF